MLLAQVTYLALRLARESAGSRSATRIPIIAIVTSSSISVNPRVARRAPSRRNALGEGFWNIAAYLPSLANASEQEGFREELSTGSGSGPQSSSSPVYHN